jgi:phosphoribosylformimino-5-aminoimidazole carboxamide ribotide isomerase
MITIIPAIDIMSGKCVRLIQGNYALKTVYSDDPLAMAQMFEQLGIKRLHLVDLDGAREKKIVNSKVLKKIAYHTALKIDFGGGIQSEEDAQMAFDCGADQITVGTIAVKNKDLVLSWLLRYGGERIILGADVREKRISIYGWQKNTEIDILSFLNEYSQAGMKYTICTDINKDGLLTGPAIELYAEIKEQIPELYLIASGGVSRLEDVAELSRLNINGVIIGKAIYEGKIKLEDLKPYLC